MTVSRQAGAGGRSFAQALTAALNAPELGGTPPPAPWRAWNRELVEKVATEGKLEAADVAGLEEEGHPWLRAYVESLVPDLRRDESAIYRSVSAAIRQLAVAGRAVIVGRGGVFVTAGLPTGVHVHLVAPLEHRIDHLSRLLNVSTSEAAGRVAQIERNRTAFYRRHWPDRRIEPETFDLTLNAGALSNDEMVACVLPLIEARTAASVPVPDEPPRTLAAAAAAVV